MPPSSQSEVVPYIDWDLLPPLFRPKTFISAHANPVDAMLTELHSATSKRVYESRLASVARRIQPNLAVREVPWHLLRYEHMVKIKESLIQSGQSFAGVNLTLSALRSVAKTAFRLQQLDAADLMRINNVKMIRGSRLPSGREIRIGELESLVRACTQDRHLASATRDVTILGFLYICGLRRAEFAAINYEDIDLDTGTLKLIGKGNKERLAYPDTGTLDALRDWLRYRGTMDGPLLLSINKSGVINFSRGRISDQSIYDIVKKRQIQAGVSACSPHDFRRSFATELLRQGKDLPTVQRLMGHADPKTTSRYDVRKPEEDRRATEILHLPYAPLTSP